MLFREFLTAFVVEMYCDEFEKHTMVQIYSNFFTKNCYMRYWVQISSDTKLPQTFPDSKVPRIHTLSVIILYRIHARWYMLRIH